MRGALCDILGDTFDVQWLKASSFLVERIVGLLFATRQRCETEDRWLPFDTKDPCQSGRSWFEFCKSLLKLHFIVTKLYRVLVLVEVFGGVLKFLAVQCSSNLRSQVSQGYSTLAMNLSTFSRINWLYFELEMLPGYGFMSDGMESIVVCFRMRASKEMGRSRTQPDSPP